MNKIYPRILIIDDDKDVGLFFETCLREKQFHVTLYYDPLKALSDFKPNYYDLVLIDIRMPQMNGFELYERIRRIDKNQKVCFITAFEEYYNSLMEQFPKLDVNCFIKKPVLAEDLITHIMKKIINRD